MKASQKIALEMSAKREALNALLAIDEMDETQRSEMGVLTTRMQELETEARAAIMAEDVPMITHTVVEDGADRELRSLIDRANIGHIFEATLEHRSTDGAEAELQAHYKLSSNAIPLSLLETRAVTPAPSDVGQNMSAIIPGVFPQSCAAFLGIDMPTVGVGEAVFPVLTTNATVGTPAENAAQAETTGSFSAEVLQPARLQAAFFYSREDRARFAGMDEALRMNLSEALSDGLDQQILAGTNGLFTGGNIGNHNVSAVHVLCELSQRAGLCPSRWHLREQRGRYKDGHGKRNLWSLLRCFSLNQRGRPCGARRLDASHGWRKGLGSCSRRRGQQAERDYPAGQQERLCCSRVGGRDADSR